MPLYLIQNVHSDCKLGLCYALFMWFLFVCLSASVFFGLNSEYRKFVLRFHHNNYQFLLRKNYVYVCVYVSVFLCFIWNMKFR